VMRCLFLVRGLLDFEALPGECLDLSPVAPVLAWGFLEGAGMPLLLSCSAPNRNREAGSGPDLKSRVTPGVSGGVRDCVSCSSAPDHKIPGSPRTSHPENVVRRIRSSNRLSREAPSETRWEIQR